MDVNGSPHVPTWINGREVNYAVLIGDLIAAQELLVTRVILRHVGIETRGITMPDLHPRSRQSAASRIVAQTHLLQ